MAFSRSEKIDQHLNKISVNLAPAISPFKRSSFPLLFHFAIAIAFPVSLHLPHVFQYYNHWMAFLAFTWINLVFSSPELAIVQYLKVMI